MRFSTSFIAAAAAVSGVQALSSGCTAQVGILALSDLGSCLQLTSLLPVLTGSGSIVSSINTYLGALCASGTARCSNSTLTSSQASIKNGCSSDISSGGTDGAEVTALLSVLQNYPYFYNAACSKNSTTSGYCVTETLSTVQNTTGSDVSISSLAGLLAGGGNSSSLASAFTSGNLCTGCVGTIYQQALAANASISSSTVGQALTGKCGANFGSAAASGVSTVAGASATSSAASSASASSSRSAADASVRSMATLLPLGIAGVSIMGAMALGGLSVL